MVSSKSEFNSTVIYELISFGGVRGSVVDVIKLFLEEISISPKLRNGKKFVIMSKLALKCVNNAILSKYSL